VREDARRVGLQWRDIGPIITRVADRLAQHNARSGGPDHQLAETSAVMAKSTTGRRRERDPNVVLRQIELGNVTSSKPNATAWQICTRWDFSNIRVPEHWQVEGISTWIAALRKWPNKVQKLVSVDKKKILN
jgi:hypothetical protein